MGLMRWFLDGPGPSMPQTCCNACGMRYRDLTWPRQCFACNHVLYLNPLPVAILLVPVDNGLLLVQRRLHPAGLALPGGFLEGQPRSETDGTADADESTGIQLNPETWQEGAVRELAEETGLQLAATDVTLHSVHSAVDSNTVLICGSVPQLSSAQLPDVVRAQLVTPAQPNTGGGAERGAPPAVTGDGATPAPDLPLNEETAGLFLLTETPASGQLVFPLHEQIVRDWFGQREATTKARS